MNATSFIVDPMSLFGVYYIRNKLTGWIYVGSTKKKFSSRKADHWTRLNGGYHCNPPLQRAWQLDGEASFEFVIAEKVELSSTVISREQFHIDQHFGEGCYNLQPEAGSSMKGFRHSTKSREKMSRVQKQQPPRSAEARAKQSASRMGKSWHTCSQSFREKVSKIKKGKPAPKHVLKAMREALDERMALPLFREINNAHLRALAEKNKVLKLKAVAGVLVSPTGEEFAGVVGLKPFCEAHGLKPSGLSAVLCGDQKSHRGWTYRKPPESPTEQL